jgi:hypothetical protein
VANSGEARRLAALRETLDASIARCVSHSAEEVNAAVKARLGQIAPVTPAV